MSLHFKNNVQFIFRRASFIIVCIYLNGQRKIVLVTPNRLAWKKKKTPFLKICIGILLFQNKVSLLSPGWPETSYIDQGCPVTCSSSSPPKCWHIFHAYASTLGCITSTREQDRFPHILTCRQIKHLPKAEVDGSSLLKIWDENTLNIWINSVKSLPAIYVLGEMLDNEIQSDALINSET